MKSKKVLYCTYCGEIATDRDHVIPCYYRRIRTYARLDITVPSCSHCNSNILRYLPLFTVKDRKEYVANWLQTKLFNTDNPDEVLIARAKWSEENANIILPTSKIITTEELILEAKSKGLNFYIANYPCKYGHEPIYRFNGKKGRCLECSRIDQRRRDAAKKIELDCGYV